MSTSSLVTPQSDPAGTPTIARASLFKNLHVLIVEDNIVNQKLLEKHLTRNGCITSCANHGQEAIDIIRQSLWAQPDGQRIDCVLMDIEVS